jgi:hypothetical protein
MSEILFRFNYTIPRIVDVCTQRRLQWIGHEIREAHRKPNYSTASLAAVRRNHTKLPHLAKQARLDLLKYGRDVPHPDTPDLAPPINLLEQFWMQRDHLPFDRPLWKKVVDQPHRLTILHTITCTHPNCNLHLADYSKFLQHATKKHPEWATADLPTHTQLRAATLTRHTDRKRKHSRYARARRRARLTAAALALADNANAHADAQAAEMDLIEEGLMSADSDVDRSDDSDNEDVEAEVDGDSDDDDVADGVEGGMAVAEMLAADSEEEDW